MDIRGYRDLPPVEDYDFLFRALEHEFKLHNLSEKLLKYPGISCPLSQESFHG